MMRSLYSGVSGLQNHQTRMDVIGNNISNVNTYGFKKERVTFQDMLSQTMSGASEPKQNIGGINPKQVGLGMMVASIDKIMTQGSLQSSGKNTDIAMSGDGFFIVKDRGKTYYTRDGSFDLDKEGFYVNPANGNRVQGWMAKPDDNGNPVIQSADPIEDIRIPIYSKIEAKETKEVIYKSNLNANAEPVPPTATPEERLAMINDPDPAKRRGHVTSINVYDTQGNVHKLKLTMWKTNDNQWTAEAELSDASNLSVDVAGPGGNVQVPGNLTFQMGFSPDGKLQTVSDGADSLANGDLDVQINYSVDGNPEPQNFTLKLGEAGLMNGVTQFASDFTTKAVEQDGYTMGYMESFMIDNSGTVTGVYSNGVQQKIAQVATAVFTNPGGLNKVGDNRFAQSINSGEANIGEAGSQGRGMINAGLLEMANVDLAETFTDMIVTQRGFQANSKTIVTSDQMLQELIGLKR